MGSSQDELVDELDEHGTVIRTVTRAEMRRHALRHRSVGIVVRNSAGQVLIHRRSPDKDVYPGVWDLVAGGVVASGEDERVAAERELAEEMGIIGAELNRIGHGSYEDERLRTISTFFATVWDGPVYFADGEVVEAVWVSVDELRRRMTLDEFIPDSATLATRYVLTGRQPDA